MDVLCRQSNIEFSAIGQPLDYATNHKNAPLSHNVAVITSYKHGLTKYILLYSSVLESNYYVLSLIKPVLNFHNFYLT